MLDASTLTSVQPAGRARRRPAGEVPSTAGRGDTAPAVDGVVGDRLARLEHRVQSLGHRLTDTGEDLADTLEQLVADVSDLRERVAAEATPPAPATGDGITASRAGGASAAVGEIPTGPGLLRLYGTLAQVTAESWMEHVVRPTLRRAATLPARPWAGTPGPTVPAATAGEGPWAR